MTKVYEGEFPIPAWCQIAIRDDGAAFRRERTVYKGHRGWGAWQEMSTLPEGLSDDLLTNSKVRLPLTREEQEVRNKKRAEERAKWEAEEAIRREEKKGVCG